MRVFSKAQIPLLETQDLWLSLPDKQPKLTGSDASINLEATVPVSIFHVGLSLDHPLIPVAERTRIEERLRDLQQRMTRAGYQYKIIQASPESGLEGFKHHLATQPCDAVLIGGGVVGNESMSYFMEQIIDATHHLAPRAKILFYNHSEDVRSIVERWFGAQPG